MGYFEDKKGELEELLRLLYQEKAYFETYVKGENIKIEQEKIAADSYVKQEQEKIRQEQLAAHQESLRNQEIKEGLIQMAKEKSNGFPWLAEAYDELFARYDNELVKHLLKKQRPAVQAAVAVREQTKLKRAALKEKKILEYIIAYYESIAPFLVDLREEISEETEDAEIFKDYTEEELQDEVTHYITKEEYRKLSSIERNQLALDRFKKRPKSKWLIGKIYERYVGYLYEEEGYDVEYKGIIDGYEDLGRDLICTKNNDIVIIQCKNWSQFKTIYEKHLFQFFGTVFQYKATQTNKNIKAIFYTSTKVSDLARVFAQELKIEIKENFSYDADYPCIKCNISKSTKEKIYHLPFDQQYDKIKIEPLTGEFYCTTVQEAEAKGFRRAFKYTKINNPTT